MTNRVQTATENPPLQPRQSRVAGFRTRLLIAMMLIVSGVTALALYFAERNLAAAVEADLEREFQSELEAMNRAEEIRHAALAERCRALVRRARIHAALEDGALDLLYPSAEDELRDIVQRPDEVTGDGNDPALRAEFYRFLDRYGKVIRGANLRAAGELQPTEEAQLSLPGAPSKQQVGYLRRKGLGGAESVFEIIAMPIVSTDTGEVTAALVLGFKPFELAVGRAEAGVWLDGRLHGTRLPPASANALAEHMRAEMARPDGTGASRRIELAGVLHQVFHKRLNADSLYPPAYEVCVYALDGLHERQWQLRWRVLAAGGLLLFGGLLVSRYAAGRLAGPVEKLAVDSEEQRAQRERAEAALETTNEELQRSARFSADASHQLKTPVTVLRAGLEELLAHEKFTPQECDQISALIHQTFRLSSLIEDLLLLSRMDAGRLKLNFAPVDLSHLIEAALDDLGALPDELDLRVETDFPPALSIAGEQRYTTIILQNLFENARKYNQPGGTIRIVARQEADAVMLTVGNTGRPISAAARAHIFERFHRGPMGENVPGYGLGLNLARELARLHGGDLKLARAEESWTEFEVRFKVAVPKFSARANV